jgi:hypothetical protein
MTRIHVIGWWIFILCIRLLYALLESGILDRKPGSVSAIDRYLSFDPQISEVDRFESVLALTFPIVI